MNEAYLKRTYGITLAEYRAIYKEQKGLCAICGKMLRPPDSTMRKGTKDGFRAELDHSHKIKDKRSSIRGILCGGRHWGCNRRLGRVDSADWLQNALQYLLDPPAQRVLKED